MTAHSPDPSLQPEPGGCRMTVLYEDSELVIFNKPSGLPSAAHSDQDSGTAVHHALAHCPLLPAAPALERGLLHRLDTGTSGVLAFAKTTEIWSRLRDDWQRQTRKTYRALSLPPAPPRLLGSLPLDVTLAIGNDAKSSKRVRVLDPTLALPMKRQLARIRGRPFEARSTLLRICETKTGALDLEIEIHTGVRHQIRAHFAHLGYPLLGDDIYGGAESTRLWLHAWKLEIAGRTVEAPLPEGWPAPK